MVDQVSSKDLVVPAESVDVATNDLLASTTCFSRLTALLNVAMLLHRSADGVQIDSRMPPMLGLLAHPLGLLPLPALPKTMVRLATDLTAVVT